MKICQFLVHNGRLVRNSTVLKKQDSFKKFASMFGDQLLLQFVEKCNIVLCCNGCTLSRWSTSKIPSSFQKTDANLLDDDFWVLNLFGCWEPLSLHSLDCSLVSGSYTHTQIQASSILMRRLKYPTGSLQNWSKMACEARIRSRF
jgi:hypothetical protein